MKKQILETEYKPKHIKTAEFVAWLTDGVCLEDNGILKIVSRSELSKLIAEKYDNNDYIGADNLLRSARKSLGTSIEEELSQIFSRSIRVSTPTMYQIIEFSKLLNCSRSDIIRRSAGPKMREILDRLSKELQISEKKLSTLQNLLSRWLKKKDQAPRGVSGVVYIGDLVSWLRADVNLNQIEQEMMDKWAEHQFITKCEKIGISRSFAERFWIETETHTWDPEMSIVLNPHGEEKNTLEFSFGDQYRGFVGHSALKDSHDQRDNKSFAKLFMNFSVFFQLDNEECGLYIGVASDVDPFEDEKAAQEFFELPHRPAFDFDLLLDTYSTIGKIKIEKKDKDRRIIYCGVPVDKDHMGQISEIFLGDLIGAAYNIKDKKGGKTKYPIKMKMIEEWVQEMKQKSMDALSKGDLKTSSDLSNRLAFVEASKTISDWMSDTLIQTLGKTHVITFTIPALLLRLWDAAEEHIDLETLFFEEE